MSQDSHDIHAVSLTTEQDTLLESARTSHARRAAGTVYGSRETVLRQTVIALQAGSELGEHDSPPEATLHVLTGRVRLMGKDRSWELTTGDLVPIPPERHSVSAIEDSAFLLTVVRATAEPVVSHHTE